MSFEHHAFKWKKPNLHASISVLIVFTQAICRRPRQSWKGIHPESCFRATDYETLGPATMPIRIDYKNKRSSLKQTIASSKRQDEKSDATHCHVHSACAQEPMPKSDHATPKSRPRTPQSLPTMSKRLIKHAPRGPPDAHDRTQVRPKTAQLIVFRVPWFPKRILTYFPL